MAKSYSDLWADASALEKEGADVANFNEAVTKLPYQLKDEFRKAQDPKLDQAINKAQSDTFGAAIKGLDMYKDISDPFARRNLAEQYQGGIEMGWKNLTDERTRRAGVYSDYIAKWTGLFGAEAAKKQDLFNNKVSTWEREKNLADTAEDQRRWEITNARAERGSGGSNKDYTNQEITSAVNTLKNEGKNWEEISQFLAEKGVDVVHKSFADSQLNRAFDPNFKGYEDVKEQSWSEKNSQLKYEEAVRDGNGTEQNPYKTSSQADYGDYYWSGTTKKKKVKGWDPKV